MSEAVYPSLRPLISVHPAYYAIGTRVYFVAITQPTPKSDTMALVEYDLDIATDRIACFVLMIRMCQVLTWMAKQIPEHGHQEFKSFCRYVDLVVLKTNPYFLYSPDNLTTITLGATVKKEFGHDNAADIVRHIVKIYELLKEKQVGYRDELEKHSDKERDCHIITSPVGISGLPQNGYDSYNMIVCALKALIVSIVFLYFFLPDTSAGCTFRTKSCLSPRYPTTKHCEKFEQG